VAYRPFNDTKTVVRAGFGIYTMTNLGPLSFNNSGNPTSSLHSYANTNTVGPNTPQIRFPNTAPPTVGAQIGGGSLDQGVDPNYRDPQSNQWNITVERELTNNTSIRASYVGMHTYRLSITEDLNQIPASTTPFTTTAASRLLTHDRLTQTGQNFTAPSTRVKQTTGRSNWMQRIACNTDSTSMRTTPWLTIRQTTRATA
jgi:hypothetical protein